MWVEQSYGRDLHDLEALGNQQVPGGHHAQHHSCIHLQAEGMVIEGEVLLLIALHARRP